MGKSLKCDACGRFTSNAAGARIKFKPDDAFGPEETEITCRDCRE